MLASSSPRWDSRSCAAASMLLLIQRASSLRSRPLRFSSRRTQSRNLSAGSIPCRWDRPAALAVDRDDLILKYLTPLEI
jgi:hypothetical protein